MAAANEIAEPQRGQRWQRWPIRLYTDAKSAKLLGFDMEFESLKRLGQKLIVEGETRYYHHDLSWLFK